MRATSTVTPPETFGARLRSARQSRGWTLAALAEKSGVALGYIWRLEKDKQTPGLGTVSRLAAALGVRPESLAGWGRQ